MQNLPLNNENSKGCIRIQIDSPRNFGLTRHCDSNDRAERSLSGIRFMVEVVQVAKDV